MQHQRYAFVTACTLLALMAGPLRAFFSTHLWTGSFVSTPVFQRLIDAQLLQPGKTVFGSGDADVDFGGTGTLHAQR